jgi:hypothetical protein
VNTILRRLAFIVAGIGVLAVAVPKPSSAQTASDARLIFSIFGGIAAHGDLWDIPKQQYLTLFPQPLYDTLNLRRRLATGPVLGLNATFYSSSHWGLSGEVAYVGLRKDTDCSFVYLVPDAQQRNEQVCNDIAATVTSASNVGVSFGGAFRFVTHSLVTPYVRLMGGLSIRSSSLVQVTGRLALSLPDGSVALRERVVISDEKDVSLYPLLAGAAGIMFTLSPGYQIRAEVRDQLMILQRPTGPANDLAVAEIESFIGHSPALVFGFDIVLERQRGRRY